MGPVQNVVSDVKSYVQKSLEIIVPKRPHESLLVWLFWDGQKCFDFLESNSPIFVIDLESYESV